MKEKFAVLVSDSMSDAGLAPLQAAPNLTVDVTTGQSQEKLIELIGELRRPLGAQRHQGDRRGDPCRQDDCA